MTPGDDYLPIMKNFILNTLLIIIAFSPATLFGKSDEKTAILMVHFGSTYDETRSKTIDAINRKVSEAFPEATIVDAFSSRIIIKRLKERGINKSTPQEALLKLAADGYEKVIIQGSYLLDGIENQVLQQEADLMKPFFKEIRLGRPLLYSVKDCEQIVSILSEDYLDLIKDKEGIVFVGHGTSTPANATYSQIDYMFSSIGYKDINVATIEGYPTFENLLVKLKEQKTKKVTLIPFMFVAGDHASNDISNDWRDNLKENGYDVSVILKGLGENPRIQEMYIDHIREVMENNISDVKSHKKKYIKENL